MRTAEQVVRSLRARGELWESAPGVVGLRGDALALYRALERRLAEWAAEQAADEWMMPAAIPLETLARAEYFASFPQWLTAASHLGDDRGTLERVAAAPDPAREARAALAPASAALAPAVCYHTYAALADSELAASFRMTAQATCWRHEGERLRPLERGWAFTMREVVCMGAAEEVEAFRRRGMEDALGLAAELGLDARVEPASDPFFAPGERGKALLQQIKGLKHELLLPVGAGRRIAAASFNHHESYFGDAFRIRLPDGRPAASGCVAFGVERWLLAVLVAHGLHAEGWPLPVSLSQEV